VEVTMRLAGIWKMTEIGNVWNIAAAEESADS
jgi:hypothetical protein